MTGGYNKTEQYLDDYTEKYFNDVLSKEERYIEWFDSVVGLISWLENIGIGKFNSFNMNIMYPINIQKRPIFNKVFQESF